MIYDLSNKVHLERFNKFKETAIKNGYMMEFKQVKPPRTNQQNKYLHLILSWFGCEYGETSEYVKQYFFKELVNAEMFKSEYANPKTGEIRISWKSTKDLDTKELTNSIERFRNWSNSTAGIYLPAPNETEYLKQIMVEMEYQKIYI